MRTCTEDKCRLQAQVCFGNVLGVNGSTKHAYISVVLPHLNHCKYIVLVSCCLILLLSCLLMQRLSAQLIVVVCYICKHPKLVYHAQFCHDLCGGGYCALSNVLKIHLESVCYDKPW